MSATTTNNASTTVNTGETYTYKVPVHIDGHHTVPHNQQQSTSDVTQTNNHNNIASSSSTTTNTAPMNSDNLSSSRSGNSNIEPGGQAYDSAQNNVDDARRVGADDRSHLNSTTADDDYNSDTPRQQNSSDPTDINPSSTDEPATNSEQSAPSMTEDLPDDSHQRYGSALRNADGSSKLDDNNGNNNGGGLDGGVTEGEAEGAHESVDVYKQAGQADVQSLANSIPMSHETRSLKDPNQKAALNEY